MRYRALSPTGDSTFGSGFTAFLVNIPATVRQAIQTRLGLVTGEWFLDVTSGTPYLTKIVGKNQAVTYDAALRERILGTEGVISLITYSSNLDRASRKLSVSGRVNTVYGQTDFSSDLTLSPAQ